MKTNVFVIVLMIVLAAGGIWYVKNSNPMEPATEKTGEEAQPSVAPPASDSAGTQETIATSDAKEIMVEASEFKFLPTTLKLTKGEHLNTTALSANTASWA